MKWSKLRFSDLVAAATKPKSFQAVDSARANAKKPTDS